MLINANNTIIQNLKYELFGYSHILNSLFKILSQFSFTQKEITEKITDYLISFNIKYYKLVLIINFIIIINVMRDPHLPRAWSIWRDSWKWYGINPHSDELLCRTSLIITLLIKDIKVSKSWHHTKKSLPLMILMP